jgi:hypothetical protein
MKSGQLLLPGGGQTVISRERPLLLYHNQLQDEQQTVWIYDFSVPLDQKTHVGTAQGLITILVPDGRSLTYHLTIPLAYGQTGGRSFRPMPGPADSRGDQWVFSAYGGRPIVCFWHSTAQGFQPEFESINTLHQADALTGSDWWYQTLSGLTVQFPVYALQMMLPGLASNLMDLDNATFSYHVRVVFAYSDMTLRFDPTSGEGTALVALTRLPPGGAPDVSVLVVPLNLWQ